VEELNQKFLQIEDPRYPIVVAARAVKTSDP
jgi:hypothetical protein